MTTSSGSGPRRSARARARRQPPDDDAPPTPPSVAPPPDAGGPSSSSPPSRRKRGESPSRRSVRAREDDLQPPAAVLDDDEVKHRIKADEQKKQGMEIVEAEGPNEVDENAEALKEAPFWLPDGWIINVRHGDGGSTYRYYTSPVSDYTFSTDMAALDYLFSEMDERILESEACADNNKLPKTHAWLPDGWVIEVRAGKMRDKMYKFYVHLPTGMRFFSKEEVLRYVNEGAISGSDVKGLCDTISEDNILAQVEFNPDGLPKGWVKEVIFRKCDDGIRKDPSYTDPVSHLVFRTLKSVMSYLETGEISKHAYLPRRSVTEIYSFDGCTDLPRKMLKRLKVQGKKKQKSVQSLVFEKILPDDQTSNRSEGGTSASMNPRSDPKETRVDSVEAKGKEPISSETTKRPRGRPRKISKQTNEITSDCTKSSDNEITPIKTCSDKEVKNELDTETGKRLLKENAPEDNEMEKKKQKSVESLVFEKKLPDDWTSNCSQGDNSAIMIPQSDPKEKRVNTVEAKGNEVISSETTKRPRGRPRKIPNPTNETTSECTKGSDKEITPIETGSDEEVKKELDTETGKQLSKENTPEDNEMEKKKQKSVESLVFEKKLPDDRTSNCSQGDNSAIMIPQSDPKEKRVNTVEAKGNEVISSETTKRPRGRPRKIPNQTNETTSECTKGSDKEITPIETGSDEEVKKELDTETGKQLLKENTPEDNEMEKKKQKSVESLVFEKKLPDDRTSNCSQGDTSAIMIPRSDPKEKRDNTVEVKGNEVISSETTKRPRGRPRKIPKQTNETTSECTKSTDKEITPIETGSEEEVKKELDTETGEQMSKGNTPDDNNEMEKHATTIPEVDDKSDLARSISSWRRGSPGPVTDAEMSEQENGDPAEDSAKPISSAVQKFYMRRNSNQSFKKECKENADHQ